MRRRIFLVEGLASIVMGVVTFFFLPDTPSLSKWLKPEEARFLELEHILLRGRKTPESKRTFSWKTIRAVLTDWQLYLQALVFMSNAVPNYGLKFTMPQIIRNMGFTSSRAQLLTAP